jgi:hypothetical protein
MVPYFCWMADRVSCVSMRRVLLRICLGKYMSECIYLSRRICDNGCDESPFEL